MPKIDRIYAWVVADKDENDEGVPAFASQIGPMPMVGADYPRAESMVKIAQDMANQTGKPIELRVFTEMTTVKIVRPEKLTVG